MKKFLYRGWFGHRARRRCPHSKLNGIYGDMIITAGYYRIWCGDCGRTLDGPVVLADMRVQEHFVRDQFIRAFTITKEDLRDRD